MVPPALGGATEGDTRMARTWTVEEVAAPAASIPPPGALPTSVPQTQPRASQPQIILVRPVAILSPSSRGRS